MPIIKVRLSYSEKLNGIMKHNTVILAFMSRERVASFLNFVPVNLEITKTVFVFSIAVQIVDTEIS